MMPETIHTDYPYARLIGDIMRRVRPYRARFWFASVLRFSADIIYLYTAYALARVIDFFTGYTSGTPLTEFWFFLITWGGTYIYTVTARQVAKFFCYQVAERVNLDLQLDAVKHLARLDMSWHEGENTGNKLKRLQNGGEGIERLICIWIDNIIEIGVNFVGMIIILAFIDVRVALIMIVFLGTHLLITIPLGSRAAAAARVVNQHEEDFSGVAFEILNNIRSVKVMGMLSRIFPLLLIEARRIFRTVTIRVQRFRLTAAVQGYWSVSFRFIAMIFIAYGIVQGRYEVGFLILFNFYFTALRTSVEETSNIFQDIIVARNHLTRLTVILTEPIRIDDDTKKVGFPEGWKVISLRNVSFTYGGNPVLKNVSFDIHRGERIGIVGLSGAGKSTLFKLLLKEYEDFTGDILFDDLSIRKIKKSAYFERVAVVLQDTEVFHFSLRDNITIADPAHAGTEARLDRAITTAHVADFLDRLPQGLDTLIGEKGIKLSGGEKQRVGIARAIFKEPDILFLDEATSHLDLESEEKIKDSLQHVFEQVTAVVIAHRLTTIQAMDRILLIEDGQLIESGTFETLYQAEGRFFELWQKQKI